MAGQIHEDAAAGAQKIDRTEAVAAHAAEHLDGADRSGGDQLPGPRVAPVIPPLKPDLEGTPAARTASAAASALGTESASGFSEKIGFPALAARAMCSSWATAGDATTIASTSLRARSASTSGSSAHGASPDSSRRAGVRHRRPPPRGERR